LNQLNAPNVDALDISPGTVEPETLYNVSNVEGEDTSPVIAGVRETEEGVLQHAELGALPFLSKCSHLSLYTCYISEH